MMAATNRRKSLIQMGAIAALPSMMEAAGGSSPSDALAPTPSNRIVEENKLPGTNSWMLTNSRIDPSTKYRCPWIEGYCGHPSVDAGQEIAFHWSTLQSTEVVLEIFRLGYYQGTGGRLVHRSRPIPSMPQPVPAPGQRRLIDCQWPAMYRWQIPKDALSGVYLGKMTEQSEGVDSYTIFIVRDNRQVDLLFQCSDHTWQAYNRWPSQFSLYDDGVNQWHWGDKSEVSFRRPYGRYCQIFDAPLSTGSGEFLLWEFPFSFWLEAQGYDVSYQSNTDTHRQPETLSRCRALLSVGHDEYWTDAMYAGVQKAIEQGVSVGFFSGNAVCGKVEWNPQSQSLHRIGVFGPPGGTGEFESMSQLKHEPPYANALIGAHSTGPVTGGADWICRIPEHWVMEGTGMRQGDGIPGLVGWEWHGDPAPIQGLEILASGPTQSAPGQLNGGQYTSTLYPGPRGNWVFNASTIWWADGLSQPPGYVRPSVYTTPKGPDPRVQRITRNLLDRMIRDNIQAGGRS
jgi:hypothetical protein